MKLLGEALSAAIIFTIAFVIMLYLSAALAFFFRKAVFMSVKPNKWAEKNLKECLNLIRRDLHGWVGEPIHQSLPYQLLSDSERKLIDNLIRNSLR